MLSGVIAWAEATEATNCRQLHATNGYLVSPSAPVGSTTYDYR